MKSTAATTSLLLAAILNPGPFYCRGFSSPSPTKPTTTVSTNTFSFSVPLISERPTPQTRWATLQQLWNDPRPVTSLIGDAIGNTDDGDERTKSSDIPYCLWSDEFLIGDNQQQHSFRILLYPRCRFASAQGNQQGPAAAYVRYIPQEYGDEVDVAWKLRLVDTRTNTSLPIMTSGGMPRSNTTWSAAMTFCSEHEDLGSVGRAADWGSSTWFAAHVCQALGYIVAEGEMTIYEARQGESSFAIPPKGAIKACFEAAQNAGNPNLPEGRSFCVGEVIVPMPQPDNLRQQLALETSYFVAPGTDYRIMTMTDKHGTPIFSSDQVPPNERKDILLALRPCGWKLQPFWKNKKVEWPVEVPAGLLSTTALSRFNFATALPRVTSTFQRDKTAVLLGVLLALAPLSTALIGRNFVSFYAIPSASMDPTLRKGDVLLVDKLSPRVFLERNYHRGDIVLFRPPSALTDIAGTIDPNSLFVKRVVGMPGDKNIVLDPRTREVTIDGQAAVGPNRNLCDDEPLRLIDRLLANGKGRKIAELADDEVYVLGDCQDVSVDSRVFGVLPQQNIEGKPMGRIWPPSRITFGKL